MLEVQLASSSKWSCKHHSLLYNVMLLQQCGEERRLRILSFWPPSQQLLDDTFSLVMSTHNSVMSANSSGDMHIYLQQLSITICEFLKQQCQWQQHIQSAACFDSILMPMQLHAILFCHVVCRDSKGKGKSTISDGLQLPDVDTVLPLQTALQGLRSQPPAAVKLVYLHWCQKRQYSERPLLQRLWYEPPWHRLTVAGRPNLKHVQMWLPEAMTI